MANIKSQKKRTLTNEKAHQRNVAAKSAVKTAAKRVRVAVEAKKVEEANTALVEAYRLIDKTVSDGIQKKNTAARQKSSLAKLVNSLNA